MKTVYYFHLKQLLLFIGIWKYKFKRAVEFIELRILIIEDWTIDVLLHIQFLMLNVRIFF